MDPTPIIDAAVQAAQAYPRTATALAAVPVVQMALPLLALLPALWGGNTGDTGAGSGWSRWCRRLAALPIRIGTRPPVK